VHRDSWAHPRRLVEVANGLNRTGGGSIFAFVPWFAPRPIAGYSKFARTLHRLSILWRQLGRGEPLHSALSNRQTQYISSCSRSSSHRHSTSSALRDVP